jgi:KipI family sensor histidine kinase inhibitor
MRLSPLGDSAVLIAISDPAHGDQTTRVRAVAAEIERKALPGILDVVPVFGSVAVFFDPVQVTSLGTLQHELSEFVAHADAAVVTLEVPLTEIPVCYGGEYGPDLQLIAARTKKTVGEVVALHAGVEYRVHAIGFTPGFPYLGGLPPELASPRRATPRPRVPAGSVGIGGTQTGIYPLETPGGWNLIGRTPLNLFDAGRPGPALVQAGDRVRFRPIGSEEFVRLRAREEAARLPVEPPRGISGEWNAAAPLQRASGIEVVRAGMFTTVQDLGRKGHRAQGVPLSGAADPFALRVANLLVGNREEEAGLEFTLVGPELKFLHATVIAITGAEFDELPRWRPIAIEAGTTLRIGPARSGCRGYLAIAGGIDIAPVLGSRSTYVRAALGGLEGRRLVDGDVLPVPAVRRNFRDHWRIDERILPRYSRSAVVRIVPGVDAHQFDEGWTNGPFNVSAQSDRMGVRMTGAPLRRIVEADLISGAVAPGTMQVPPDGQPIVLLADAQTIGGYPQVAHVIAVDLPVMAQLRPGDEVRFVGVSLEDAGELIAAQERALGLLREGLAQKLA